MTLGPANDSHDIHEAGGYTVSALAEIVGAPAEQVAKWVAQGLLSPVSGEGSVARFDFRQLTMAQTLKEMAASGASLKKLKKEMSRLRDSTPRDVLPAPIVHSDGNVFVRLGDGELAQPDGQLRLEYDDKSEGRGSSGGESNLVVGVRRGPREWYEAGIAREADGDLHAAIHCYRCALAEGGPDKDFCYALAHALAEAGEAPAAVERYRQVVEIDPRHADAWTNLGALLAELNCREAACDAFGHALLIRPDDARAHYNLADTLDELGCADEAAEHWRAYLQHDPASQWAAHARKRLGCG